MKSSIFLLVGFIIGGLLAALHQHSITAQLPSFWIGLYGLMFLLAFRNTASVKQLSISTLMTSFFASLPCAWLNAWSGFSFSILMLVIINAFALNAFHLNYQINQYRLRYETLFFAAWDTVIELFITVIFMILCWGILQLCASLFATVKINFLKELLSYFWFNIWCTTIFVSMGLCIITQNQMIVRNIRGILVLICRYLFIPLSAIGIIFIIASLITRHLSFDQTPFVSIAFLSVLFLNGLYETGKTKNPYSKWVSWLCTLFIIITPVFTLFALIAVIFHGNNNIAANGINSDNFAYLLSVTILFIYNIGYAIAALKQQKPWLKSIEKTNIILAMVFIILTTLTINPLFFSILRALPV